MIYRVDDFIENNINPITNSEYGSSWMILTLPSDIDTPMLVGANNGCAYTIKISKQLHDDWKMAIGDFIGYCDANNLNGILAISEDEYNDVQSYYAGHNNNETTLRDYEPKILVHSTSMENWHQIQKDGMLKSWNRLNITNKEPIGKQLGDPVHFSDYIMFGGGVSGEIVVNSKQSGKIIMDIDAEYKTGARLYFDAEKIAKDGLLVRDGAHIKVKKCLPLEPYLIWTATWEKVGLESQISTPRLFAELSDEKFNDFQIFIKDRGEMMKKLVDQWDKAAKKYTKDQEQSDFVESNKRVVKTRFQDMLGKKVLDLGCGYGYYTDYFQNIGADVIGVDGSANMIDIARSRYENCTFDICDITENLPYENESYDLIFCNQVLMDVENIEKVFSECYRMLKPGGIFYYSIVHPAFYDSEWVKDKKGFCYGKTISSYIEPYSFTNEFWGKTEHFHRSLAYYLNAAAEQGFSLRHTEEPVSYDGVTKNKDLPLFFFAEYEKLSKKTISQNKAI